MSFITNHFVHLNKFKNRMNNPIIKNLINRLILFEKIVVFKI